MIKAIGLVLAYIVVWGMLIGWIWLSWYKLREWRMFKYDHNPYRRKCRRCGQWQSMWDNGGTIGIDYRSWWEEIYPLGDNPKCKCKKYAEL
jgi:hypothetical protein